MKSKPVYQGDQMDSKNVSRQSRDTLPLRVYPGSFRCSAHNPCSASCTRPTVGIGARAFYTAGPDKKNWFDSFEKQTYLLAKVEWPYREDVEGWPLPGCCSSCPSPVSVSREATQDLELTRNFNIFKFKEIFLNFRHSLLIPNILYARQEKCMVTVKNRVTLSYGIQRRARVIFFSASHCRANLSQR